MMILYDNNTRTLFNKALVVFFPFAAYEAFSQRKRKSKISDEWKQQM